MPLGGRNLSALILETGRPARIGHSQATGPLADLVCRLGGRSGVGMPINVEGRLWDAILVISEGEEPLPTDAEARLAAFTELVGTAIANAEAQQRLVTPALQLRELQATAPPEADDLVNRLDGLAIGLEAVLAELREIAAASTRQC